LTLADQLVLTPQREKGGSRAIERLEYQVAWGITHLFELHASGKDYAIGFEFHDDIAVIDSASNPKKVRFYQVKTCPANQNWTITRLTKRKKEGESLKPSIAAKMLFNKIKFPNETEYLGFVSNRPGDFITSEKSVCCFTEIPKKKFDDFLIKLKSEIPSVTEDDAKLFHFHNVDYPIEEINALVKGKLSDFVEKHCGQLEYHLDGFFLTIADRCRRKSRHIEDATSFQELVDSKFITKQDVHQWLIDLVNRVKARPSWDAVSAELSIAPGPKRKLRMAWNKYEVSQYDTTDTQVAKLRDLVREQINREEIFSEEDNILSICTTILNQIKAATDIVVNLDDTYLRAVILYEWYRNEN
jgi:hypothetical protein